VKLKKKKIHPLFNIFTSLDTFWFSERFSLLLCCFIWSTWVTLLTSRTEHTKTRLHSLLVKSHLS